MIVGKKAGKWGLAESRLRLVGQYVMYTDGPASTAFIFAISPGGGSGLSFVIVTLVELTNSWPCLPLALVPPTVDFHPTSPNVHQPPLGFPWYKVASYVRKPTFKRGVWWKRSRN